MQDFPNPWRIVKVCNRDYIEWFFNRIKETAYSNRFQNLFISEKEDYDVKKKV